LRRFRGFGRIAPAFLQARGKSAFSLAAG